MRYDVELPYRGESEAFMRRHAGWVQLPGETEDEARELTARELARAELWAGTVGGLVFEWEYDPDVVVDCGPAYGCIARRDGEVMASMWGVTFDDGDDASSGGSHRYSRVVEAELALEVMRNDRDNELLLLATPELRALSAYAT